MALHWKQINRVKSNVDGQPSSLSAVMQVSDYEAAFTLMHFLFLELETHKFLHENENAVIPRTFHHWLINKDHEHLWYWNKQNLSWFKTYGTIKTRCKSASSFTNKNKPPWVPCLGDITKIGKLAKKIKRLATILNAFGTGLITTTAMLP